MCLGGLAGLGHRLGKARVAGSNPARGSKNSNLFGKRLVSGLFLDVPFSVCWDGPGTVLVNIDRRNSLSPMPASRALDLRRSATSALRVIPFIPGLGIFNLTEFT